MTALPPDPADLHALGCKLLRAAERMKRNKPAPTATMRQILMETALAANKPYDELRGPRRFRALFQPRAEAMRRMHDEHGYSLPQIGRFFSGRDHTSVLYAVRRARVRKAAEAGD